MRATAAAAPSSARSAAPMRDARAHVPASPTAGRIARASAPDVKRRCGMGAGTMPSATTRSPQNG
jgi:hypothetical protein